jgi:hypothetical protein
MSLCQLFAIDTSIDLSGSTTIMAGTRNRNSTNRDSNQSALPKGGPKPSYPHEQSADQVTRELGKTSDEYGAEGSDPQLDMPPGDELARINPDVAQIGPGGIGEVDQGFRDDRSRRDAPR